MVRRAVLTALGAAAIVAPSSAAAPIRGQTLMPGVVYSRQVEFTAHGPVVLNVISAPTTPPESNTAEVVLAPFPTTTANVTLSAPVTQVAAAGGQAIPPNGAVIVARGRQAPILTKEAPAGTHVNVRLILTPRWDTI